MKPGDKVVVRMDVGLYVPTYRSVHAIIVEQDHQLAVQTDRGVTLIDTIIPYMDIISEDQFNRDDPNLYSGVLYL